MPWPVWGFLGELPASFAAGLVTLLVTCGLLMGWPTPLSRRGQGWSGAALAAAGALMVSSLGGVGPAQRMVVEGQRSGPVVALRSDVELRPGSVVDGPVVTLLGDVKRDPGARVAGPVRAVLGEVTAAGQAVSPPDLVSIPPLLTGMQAAGAAAVRPAAQWLLSARWSRTLKGWAVPATLGLAALAFVLPPSSAAKNLARRQREAPFHTLALGSAALVSLLGATLALAFGGWLAPALGLSLLLLLTLAVGLSVSALDLTQHVAQQLARRLGGHPLAAAGLLVSSALLLLSLAWPALGLGITLLGGAWGSGSLLLTSERWRHRS